LRTLLSTTYPKIKKKFQSVVVDFLIVVTTSRLCDRITVKAFFSV
jgi:hypothetical protein